VGGIRVTLEGRLHNARIPLQVDIGFGDAVTPQPERILFPTLLNASRPELQAYPRYTLVAEKLEAMVRLGIANSRMKDFFDIWLVRNLFDFDGELLCEAVRNTFRRRSTKLPSTQPTAFTAEFRRDAQKQTQWAAFLRKSKAEGAPKDLDAVMESVSSFLLPVIESIKSKEGFGLFWFPGGPWQVPSRKQKG